MMKFCGLENILKTFLTLAAFSISAAVYALAPPPAAPLRPVTDDYYGTKVVDNYRWMENLKDPEMQRWMKAQADYTRVTLDALPGRATLLKRITALEASQPARVEGLQIVAGRYYTLRTPAGSQSPKLYVRDGLNGKDRLLIDPENLSTNSHTHFSIQGFRPSSDGHYIAYQLVAGGSLESVLHILDVNAGKDLPETADGSYGDAPYWRADDKSFFYSRWQKLAPGTPSTAKFENGRVYLHVLGQSFDNDQPILGRGVRNAAITLAPVEMPEVVTSPDSNYAIVFVWQGTDPRFRVYAAQVDAIRTGAVAWRSVAGSYDDQFIGIDLVPQTLNIVLHGDVLYWLSRKGAPRGQILRLDLAHAYSKPEVVVPQGDLPISAVYAGRDAIFWRVSDAGVNSVQRLGFAPGAQPETLHLPYAADVSDVAADLHGDAAMIHASSWLRSAAYLSVDAKTGATTLTDLQPAGPYDRPDDLSVEEVKVKSWDGTLVPLSIIHRKGIKLDGTNPTFIVGYGAYGISIPPSYEPENLIWYEHVVFAVAHVRGGGELGEAWHAAGFQATKPNTWKDFIACAQYLVDHKYTNPGKLAADAGSAGGIMIGRAIEERPDLFAAAIAEVPAADMLRFEITANGPNNVPEFGSVKTKAGFKSLYAMSSYAHVEDGVKYPAVMVTTGINDLAVVPWIPAKFAARLQAATASGKPVLLRVDYDTGHADMYATRQQIEQNKADRLSFVLWQTGDPAFQPKH